MYSYSTLLGCMVSGYRLTDLLNKNWNIFDTEQESTLVLKAMFLKGPPGDVTRAVILYGKKSVSVGQTAP